MTLSTRDKQTIIYTLTGHIDNFLVNSIDDFQILIAALHSIFIDVPPPDIPLPAQMLDKMQSIQDYLDPDFMTVHPQDETEFLYLAHSIIRGAIYRFRGMSEPEKIAYISEQQHRGEAEWHRHSQPPPIGQTRTVSEAMMPRAFAAASNTPLLSAPVAQPFADIPPLPAQALHPEIRPLITDGILTMRRLRILIAIDENRPLLVARIINHPHIFPAMARGRWRLRARHIIHMVNRIPTPTVQNVVAALMDAYPFLARYS